MQSHSHLANAIRALSMDAVQRAKSGHPGMPMGMADIAEVLWNQQLKHSPKNPDWPNRDRFILSNGHGSMLHYSLLHLSGYDLSLEDIKSFRQLHSKTPGHPEYQDTPGIETTTGPLGQGLANGVGMALAEKLLATQFNREGFPLFDHHTYVFAGDGCLMEGISHEVCSLAGTLGLGKLIVFYDDNGISIDGKVESWFSDDTEKRFHAYDWHVMPDVDGHDPAAIQQAIIEAKAQDDKPSLICCKTVIGFGSVNLAGSEKSHGSPLGDEEIALTREQLNWPHPAFHIPDDIYQQWNAVEKGQVQEQNWNDSYLAYQKAHPELAAELARRLEGRLPDSWQQTVDNAIASSNEQALVMASRKASQHSLNCFAPILPELLGGSADLSGSNNTKWSGSKTITATEFDGNYLHYGVREFGMSAIMNGLALHGGFVPYGGTFLVFSDYARNAIRLSALMKQRVIYVLTHDSIGLGEDGPTHQAIEHTAMLRLTPDLNVWRPADVIETLVAWQLAIEERNGASCLLLSRQNLDHIERDDKTIENIRRGGYIVRDCENTPDLILIATGSELSMTLEAAQSLSQEGRQVRVVSMPCCELFEQQDQAYRDEVLPPKLRARIAIEAASSDYWFKYVGLDGKIIGMNGYGLSAPAKDLYQHFAITREAIIEAGQQLLAL